MFFPSLSCFLLLSLHLASAYEEERLKLCGDSTAANAANSTFSANLAIALDTIRNNTAATGFNATTAGNTTTPVTALALCRANVSPSECQTCVDAATLGIRQACPNKTDGQVWYTLCMVRYSNVNFINKPDNRIGPMLWDTRNAPDQVSYDETVKILLQNLSSAAGLSIIRSAVGRTSLVGYRSIYGYVDCTRDITGGECTTCLSFAIQAIPSCCLGKWAGWITTPTCNIQFNMSPVHENWLNAPEIDTNTSVAQVPAPVTRPPSIAVEPGSGGGRGGGRDLMIGISVAVVMVFILVVGLMLVARKGNVGEKVEKGGGHVVGEDTEEEMMIEDVGMNSILYDLDVLVAATDNFCHTNRLGGGGFGTVYKGKMPDGKEIAVKKLAATSTQGIEEFSNEVKLLLKIQHRNLVCLLGCAVQGEEMMLVYEYLPNKSLDHFLFDKSKSALLDWTKRFNIIIGVARGLLYLHEDSQLRIIHRDIKASNILLDDQMNPKISDFGLAKLFNDDQSHLRTRRIAGTIGYMAPEYAVRGVISNKSDVFSFGILILEIISGRKNFSLQFEEERRELLRLARRLEQQGRLVELVDVTVGPFPEEDVLKCIRIGLLCCQERTQDRPTMSSTLIMLSNDSVTIPPHGRIGYQGSRDNTQVIEILTSDDAPMNPENQSFSSNSISISLDNGR